MRMASMLPVRHPTAARGYRFRFLSFGVICLEVAVFRETMKEGPLGHLMGFAQY